MKTDPIKGEITLASGCILSPQLTRTVFLSTTEGDRSTVLVENDTWCTFQLEQSDDSVSIAVTFNGEALDTIILSLIDPAFGRNWDEWSKEKELKRKKANDQWLSSNGFTPGETFSWGSVWSGFDPKSGSSSATISYASRS